MIKILITADCRYPINRIRIREKVKKILKRQGLLSDAKVSISFVGDRKMKDLNFKYRKVAASTDVLSFSFSETKIPFPQEQSLNLGEIIVSYPQARKQAGQYNVLVDEEIDKLVEHGLLHLMGIHHE